MRWIAQVLGLAVVLGGLAVAAIDGYYAVKNWHRMGPVGPGAELPNFRVRMLDGGTFSAADLRGQVTVMTFWATWCNACRGELSDLDEVDESFEGKDVQFLAVNFEGSGYPPAAQAQRAGGYQQQTKMTLPVAIDDGSMARQLRVGPIPHTAIFDRAGTLRHVHQGRVTTSTIVGQIEALLHE